MGFNSGFKGLNTFHLGYKNQSVYGVTQVAVCSQINTKHINTEAEICQFLSFKPDDAPNQQALKG